MLAVRLSTDVLTHPGRLCRIHLVWLLARSGRTSAAECPSLLEPLHVSDVSASGGADGADSLIQTCTRRSRTFSGTWKLLDCPSSLVSDSILEGHLVDFLLPSFLLLSASLAVALPLAVALSSQLPSASLAVTPSLTLF